MKPRTIHEAVDALINPARILLFKDENGYNIRGDVPSLIDQLEAAVERSGSGSGARRFGSRPPMAVGVVSLLTEIATVSATAVMERHGQHLHNIQANLRRVASDRATLPSNDTDVDVWINRTVTWANSARSTLGIEPKYPKGLRGARCPECGADTVATTDDLGEPARAPALQFEWSNEDDTPLDELPPDRMVRAVACQMCDARWWAGAQFYELKAQIQQTIGDNLTHETMAM